MERHNGRADIQVLTEVDLPDPQQSIKRRDNRLAGNHCARRIHQSRSLAKFAIGRIIVRLRDGPTGAESLLAIETQSCQVTARFRGMQGGLFLRAVQSDQQVPLFHRCAGLKSYL